LVLRISLEIELPGGGAGRRATKEAL